MQKEVFTKELPANDTLVRGRNPSRKNDPTENDEMMARQCAKHRSHRGCFCCTPSNTPFSTMEEQLHVSENFIQLSGDMASIHEELSLLRQEVSNMTESVQELKILLHHLASHSVFHPTSSPPSPMNARQSPSLYTQQSEYFPKSPDYRPTSPAYCPTSPMSSPRMQSESLVRDLVNSPTA